MRFEVYKELFEITSWRDGCVFTTRSLGCGWFPEETVKQNQPGLTNIMYVAASDDFARNNCTIRRAACTNHDPTP